MAGGARYLQVPVAEGKRDKAGLVRHLPGRCGCGGAALKGDACSSCARGGTGRGRRPRRARDVL